MVVACWARFGTRFTAATRKRNVSLGPQITSEDLADLRQEDDIRTIPIRHQHPILLHNVI